MRMKLGNINHGLELGSISALGRKIVVKKSRKLILCSKLKNGVYMNNRHYQIVHDIHKN